ncbi:hypothetical protein K488DRAFT_33612, partial [Vararia minispora EC-137]
QLACDCVVSPANAYGIMDSGYDLALARALRVPDLDLTAAAQRALAPARGYAPVGTAYLAALPAGNALGAHALAVVPTMRRPADVRWHRDVVYDAMWALLCAIARWNDAVAEEEARTKAENSANAMTDGDTDADAGAEGAGRSRRIRRILMTGLATGTGCVSAERAAAQMTLAVKHFARGAFAVRPGGVGWPDVLPAASEVERT